MPEIRMNFCAGLSYLIPRFGIVQKDLAVKAGLTEQDITDYKKGRRKGDEIERNRVADCMGAGLPEHLIRQLGMMIRSGVPGDEAYDRIRAQATSAGHSDEIAKFNRALDNFFDQIREFLRDKFGENMHTALAFEQEMLKVMPRFRQWKHELTLDLLEPHPPSLTEPEPEYVVDQPKPQEVA